MMHQTLIRVTIYFFLLLLAACGGGGGSSPQAVPTPVPTEISGTAFDGPVANATVNVYDWSNGVKGDLVGSVVSNDSGQFSLTRQAPSTVVLLEVVDGVYTEEASGQSVPLDSDTGEILRAVAPYTNGTPMTINATGLTTVATGLAEWLIETQGVTPLNAALAANQVISEWTGFDVLSTNPIDILSTKNATSSLTHGHEYGFFSAAISEITKRADQAAARTPHSKWTSIAFIKMMYRDIRADGILDGIAAGGSPLRLDNTDLSSEFYRSVLAERLMQFVLSIRNLTTLDFDAVLPFASTLNLYAHATFGGTAPTTDIRELTTQIGNFTPADGAIINGTGSRITVNFTETFEISSIELLVDDMVVETVNGNFPTVTFNLDTTNYANGPHTLTVRVKNILTNQSIASRNVTIQN